jgi:hypothetical protein
MPEELLSRRETLQRVSGLTAAATAGALAGCSGGGADSTPTPAVETPQGGSELDFAVEYDGDVGEVVITYASSVELAAGDVYVRGDGIDSTGSWSDIGGNATGGDEDMIAPFDAATVGAGSDYDIQVVWERDGTTLTLTEASGDS